jgi:glycerophosphoryl diester phosphodiesterase
MEGFTFGADGVEIDVMLCRTGEIVVFHDYEVDLLTNGTGRVKDLTLDQLRALQFDYRPGFDPGIGIPTLPEVIDSVHTHLQNGKLLDIELKGEKVGTDGLEAKAVELVKSRGIIRSAVFSSYNPLMVKRVEEIDPSLVTGILISDGVPGIIRWSRYTRWCRADFIGVQSKFVDAEYLKRWQDYRVLSFIEDIEDVNQEHIRLMELGIDGIITDSVTFMKGELN